MTAFTLVNHYRQRAGLPPLSGDTSLSNRARAHAQRSAEERRLTHTPSANVAEVLTCGRLDDRGAVREWMESPTHRPLLLSREYTRAGFGSAPDGSVTYWVGYLDVEPKPAKPEKPEKGKSK